MCTREALLELAIQPNMPQLSSKWEFYQSQAPISVFLQLDPAKTSEQR